MSDPDPKVLKWVATYEKIFAACNSTTAMFKLIDDIRPNRDELRQDHPELDARIDAAVRACNARLTGKEAA